MKKKLNSELEINFPLTLSEELSEPNRDKNYKIN